MGKWVMADDRDYGGKFFLFYSHGWYEYVLKNHALHRTPFHFVLHGECVPLPRVFSFIYRISVLHVSFSSSSSFHFNIYHTERTHTHTQDPIALFNNNKNIFFLCQTRRIEDMLSFYYNRVLRWFFGFIFLGTKLLIFFFLFASYILYILRCCCCQRSHHHRPP